MYRSRLRALKGVTDVVSGYAGGSKESAKYDSVSGGGTQHAEAIQIKYDASQIRYEQLLKSSSRSLTIPPPSTAKVPITAPSTAPPFSPNQEQKRVAEAYVRQLTEAKSLIRPS